MFHKLSKNEEKLMKNNIFIAFYALRTAKRSPISVKLLSMTNDVFPYQKI